MRRFIYLVLLFGLFSLLFSCAGGGGRSSVGIYHHYHGFGPWWGSRTHYRDRIIVVPPDVGEGPTPELPIETPVAEQLPEPPMDFPDIGMPDMDLGGFGD